MDRPVYHCGRSAFKPRPTRKDRRYCELSVLGLFNDFNEETMGVIQSSQLLATKRDELAFLLLE